MKTCFADMHIHIGRTGSGSPVKITASRDLTFRSIVTESLRRKGLDMIAVVDCASPGVQRDIQEMASQGEIMELPEGGLLHRQKLVIIPASEVETREDGGASSHHVAYFPFMRQVREFTTVMSRYITNIELSSQRAALTVRELLAVVRSTGGVLVPAHAFTPHKSLYGRVGARLGEILKADLEEIPAIELGLSADTALADRIGELSSLSFLSSSDAHSIAKIGREYMTLELERFNFKELMLALSRAGGRRITANYGMDPRLGRYHRSFCLECRTVAQEPPPVLSCPRCGSPGGRFVKGVFDRIEEIADFPESRSPGHRPPYHYQVPLHFVQGMSDETVERLLSAFGSEMAVLHSATHHSLSMVVGPAIARDIVLAREGRLLLASGGGGRHGRVKGAQPAGDQLTLDF